MEIETHKFDYWLQQTFRSTAELLSVESQILIGSKIH